LLDVGPLWGNEEQFPPRRLNVRYRFS